MADTLPEFLLYWAERTPDAVFLGEPDRGRCWSYGEAAEGVARFRARLRDLGVARGDRVAVLADNGVGWVVAYLAAIAHGAVAVPLNTRHATDDLDRALDDFEPAAIVGDPPYLGRCPSAIGAGRATPASWASARGRRPRFTARRRGRARWACSATRPARPDSRAA
jgi:acyl-CoA synthetase (AMP-forming)/AMP-acid ligase II